MEKKKDEYVKCPHCGHDKFHKDNYAQLNGVKRLTDGNGVCDKCLRVVAVWV